MPRRSHSPRLLSGIPPTFEQREELPAEEAQRKLRETLRSFLVRAAEWNQLRAARARDGEPESHIDDRKANRRSARTAREPDIL